MGPMGRTAGFLLERELRTWRRRNRDHTVTLIRPDRDIARLAGRNPLGLFDGDRARTVYPLAVEQGQRWGEGLQLEANAGRTTLTIENVALDDVSVVPAGTPAAETCVASDTNDTVGGWRYDGSPGYLTVAFTVDTTEAGTVGGFGILLSWTAAFDRELFDGVDVSEYVDRCTDESGKRQWGWGTVTDQQ